jgi:hypothetical protein
MAAPDVPAVLVVSTLISADGISSLSSIVAPVFSGGSLTCSTITMPNLNGAIYGLSSINANNTGAGTVNMNGASLTNLSEIIFNASGQISGVSSITAHNNTVTFNNGAITGVNNANISTVNSQTLARPRVIAQPTNQIVSTFNTNSMTDGTAPAISVVNTTVSTNHVYQASFTAGVAMVQTIPGTQPPAGDNFSFTFGAGSVSYKAYQVTAPDVYTQSLGVLSSVRESITTTFTATTSNLSIVASWIAGTGTNYQYPSTSISFYSPITLLDLGVPPAP